MQQTLNNGPPLKVNRKFITRKEVEFKSEETWNIIDK